MSSSQPEQTEAERRASDARHEYNNIAAIAALSRKPSLLRQVRKLWEEFRGKYPEYTDDPEHLEELLSSIPETDS